MLLNSKRSGPKWRFLKRVNSGSYLSPSPVGATQPRESVSGEDSVFSSFYFEILENNEDSVVLRSGKNSSAGCVIVVGVRVIRRSQTS